MKNLYQDFDDVKFEEVGYGDNTKEHSLVFKKIQGRIKLAKSHIRDNLNNIRKFIPTSASLSSSDIDANEEVYLENC